VKELFHRERPAAGEPAGLLVLHHGRGTSEEDLLPLADVLDPERRLHVVTPRAPLTVPGWPGHHWYVVPRVGYPDPPTFADSHGRLGAWLDGLADETGVPRERTILGGFSQGAVMSWALGAMHADGSPPPSRPAGILALSGFIPTVPDYEVDDAILAGLPVAIAHGRQDPIIGVEFGRAARDRAEAAGADVLYRESDVPHTIDPAVVPELVDWTQARS
jgi:phospholipase/carboxylesterase